MCLLTKTSSDDVLLKEIHFSNVYYDYYANNSIDEYDTKKTYSLTPLFL